MKFMVSHFEALCGTNTHFFENIQVISKIKTKKNVLWEQMDNFYFDEISEMCMQNLP